MGHQYGVLRARPDRAKREDGCSSPHRQIRAVDASGQPWRVAVNVQSSDGSEVVFRIGGDAVGFQSHGGQLFGVVGLRQHI